jgi:uncharacterized protein YdgA (DUF945 family)
MASVKTTLVNNDASQALFDIAKGNTVYHRYPHRLQRRQPVGYRAQSADYAKGDEKVTFSGGQFQLDADRDGKNISLTAKR